MSKAFNGIVQNARMVRIADIAKTTSGTTPSRGRKEYWEPAKYPWVKTGEIAFLPVTAAEEYVSERAVTECSLSLLPPGSVLVAMYGQGKTRGQSAVLEVEATTNQACFAVLPNDTFEPEFLQLWLRHSYKPLRDLSESRGGNQSNLNGAILESFKVPLIDRDIQIQIVRSLKIQFDEVDKALQATETQLSEMSNLAAAIIQDSIDQKTAERHRLGDVLEEVKKGIGKDWADFPVMGATRAGLSPARELPGKHGKKYKPVVPGTVFYNPMRILIGSIAFVDDDDAPGITSPDYVALQGKEGVLDSRWFYHWLRSPLGERCILSLARGAVRERMLFNRLAEGEIQLPDYETQKRASKALAELKPMRRAMEQTLNQIKLMPAKILAETFSMVGKT